MGSYEVLIKGGRVIDGTGAPSFAADVAIAAGRIAAVGRIRSSEAGMVLDAGGRVVAPGFIDAHAHSDFSLVANPPCESQVAQGTTTEIMGNCGYSPFPLVEASRGLTFDPPGTPNSWSTFREYARLLRRGGMGINAVPLIGHTTVRMAVMGKDERPATRGELARMKDIVTGAMREGVRGLSTGLDYPPAVCADTGEVEELADCVSAFGGVHTSHVRGYTESVVEAVEEAIAVSRKTQVRTVVSHMGTYGRWNWEKGLEATRRLDAARREGLSVFGDMMLYPTSGAWWGPRAIFPEEAYDWTKGWEAEVGRLQETIRRPESRARLRAEVEARRTMEKHGFEEQCCIFSFWDDIWLDEVGQGSPYAKCVGKTIQESAASLRKDPVDLYFDLVLAEGAALSTTCIGHSWEELRTNLVRPWMMVSTDTVGTSLERVAEPWNALQSHPRHYGTMPRLFGCFVRKEGLLTLEQAVRKLTGLPATVFGLRDRGFVREGMWADLTVFDPDAIDEVGTYRRPRAYPKGLAYVFVNGVAALEDGSLTGRLGGRLLSGTAAL